MYGVIKYFFLKYLQLYLLFVIVYLNLNVFIFEFRFIYIWGFDDKSNSILQLICGFDW